MVNCGKSCNFVSLNKATSKMGRQKSYKTLTLFDFEPGISGSNIFDICKSLGCDCNTPGWPDRFGEALSKYLNDNDKPKIRTLSLFSGAGGLDIGFHDLGFDIVASVEIEEKFCNTLKLNSGKGKKFENSTVNCIDIREFTSENLGKIDFIIGGPPCQTFSAAGRRASGVLGTTDARGVLFREYVRLLQELQPKGFLFENVYGIVGAQNGEAWNEIKQAFSEVGYKLFYRILDAADYGTPQHRERLIIVGLKDGSFCFPRPTHGPDSIGKTSFYNAGEAVDGLSLTDEEKKIGINGRFGHLVNDIPPGLNYSFYTEELGHPQPIFAWRSKFSDFMYKADPEMPVRTIKAQGGQYTGPLHWDTRYFSYSEFKRLQTFPDDYEISGSRLIAIKQIGNSVPPQLARMLALAIRIQVFNTDFPFALPTIDDYQELSFRKNKRLLTQYYREKAKAAIENIYSDKEKSFNESRSFFAKLSPKFKYQDNLKDGDYHIYLTWYNDLKIQVNCKEESPNVRILIKPNTSWTLPIDKIILEINAKDWFDVTVAWKVLDRELIYKHLKADLVQLNGYYQYDSQLNCSFLQCDLEYKDIMDSIYSGLIVSKNLNSKELSEIWKVSEPEILNFALFLRRIGYEIRNQNTNPQMKDNEWLIPYKFPTLLPESVQLNKTLV